MASYVSEQAIAELADIGEKILQEVDSNLKRKRVVEVARAYALVRRESEKIEEEARRLRLEGKLDEGIYKQLAFGYDSLGKGILEIAKSYWLAADVHVLSRLLHPEKNWGSLAEYARSELT